MRTLKKFAACLATAAVVTSTLGLTSSAELQQTYEPTNNWHVYSNPYVSHSVEYLNLSYYSNGYKALITEKGGGGAANYVIISDDDGEKTTLTNVDAISKVFFGKRLIDNKGMEYARFRVLLKADDYSNTPYNKGKIAIKDML